MAKWLTEFQVATEADCKAPWSGNPKNFRCGYCGHSFTTGDEFRCIFTNDTKAGGNPLICRKCFDINGGFEGSREAWAKKCESFKQHKKENWWFY